jgi:hypothetical protein
MAEDTLFYKELTTGANWAVSLGTADSPLPGGRNGFVNLVRDYSALNRKNMRHTDNKGYGLCYVVEVEAIGSSSAAQEVQIFTAPENWVLKNAVRKWHIARNMMLDRLGMLGEIGEYGKTIRPYLSVAHARYQGDATPDLYAPNYETTWSAGNESTSPAVEKAALVGGEWTYTEVAATADMETQYGTEADRYHLVLTGDHNNDAGGDDGNRRIFTHVSMMRSYLESRRNQSSVIQNQTGGGTIQTEPNPLVNIMADSLSTGEVKEIVQDIQREKPPYQAFVSTSESALSTNDALDLVSKCHLSTSTSYVKDKEVIRVPMGLMHVRTTANGSATPSLRFRLLGIDKCQG